jgi:hypothetical protein
MFPGDNVVMRSDFDRTREKGIKATDLAQRVRVAAG